MLREILKNKIILYLFSRYGTYILQFAISIIIAAKLGPYYLGVYGFMQLLINAFSQMNWGVHSSLNVLIVHNRNDRQKCDDYVGNSIFIYGLISLVVIALFLYVIFADVTIDNKYSINVLHYFLICVIVIAQYYSLLFLTILRVKNKVISLALAQSSNVLLNLLVVFFFDKEALIYALLICNLLSLLSYFVFVKKDKLIPNLWQISYCKTIQKEILTKGFYLFLYNSCFYFILISIRTFISRSYTVSEFGLFNFSYTLANAALLLLDALTLIILPKIIDLLSSKNYKKIDNTIRDIRISFVAASHFLIYIAMLFFPLVIYLMPKYSEALTSLNLIALSILMNTNNYGYSAFLIAQNKEAIFACISFTSLVINILVAAVLVNVCQVGFSYVILAVMVTYLCFSIMTVAMSKKLMGLLNWADVLKSFFPIRLLAPYTVALAISLLELSNFIFLPLLCFLLFNIKDIRAMWGLGKRLIRNPNIADL